MAELVCVACPLGCRLTVATAADGTVQVRGNRCPRGETWGREESLAPRRTVTAVVRTDSADFPCAPVRTSVPLARERVRELLADLYRLRVSLPLPAGTVLFEDWRGTGVRVLCTRTLPPKDVPAPGEAGPEAEGDHEVPGVQQVL